MASNTTSVLPLSGKLSKLWKNEEFPRNDKWGVHLNQNVSNVTVKNVQLIKKKLQRKLQKLTWKIRKSRGKSFLQKSDGPALIHVFREYFSNSSEILSNFS